ncbi:MAG TPA: class I SAM-dependent methyltransferase [Lutibacter sp.]|nr:class I SAM-dependent methyltransferase [Lutibacter sp.]
MNENSVKEDKTRFDFEKHWNAAYQKSAITSLGWYEENPAPSIKLIEACNLPKEAFIFNAGAGATTLISELLVKGYENLVVNDISSVALAELKNNLLIPKNAQIKFIVNDLTNPDELLKLKNIDLWHDRAVLHFFTQEKDQKAYFDLLKSVLKSKGFVILAEFNLEGAKKCSGLDVFNYNEEMLQERLGSDFELLKSFNFTYTQPSGNTREYVYTLFQKK